MTEDERMAAFEARYRLGALKDTAYFVQTLHGEAHIIESDAAGRGLRVYWTASALCRRTEQEIGVGAPSNRHVWEPGAPLCQVCWWAAQDHITFLDIIDPMSDCRLE